MFSYVSFLVSLQFRSRVWNLDLGLGLGEALDVEPGILSVLWLESQPYP